MPAETPGRRKARVSEVYQPFNAKPKEVGTRSGAPMPQNVPLTKEGFEDPSLFFRSPTGTVYNAGDMSSRRTTLGGMSAAPSSVGTSRRMRPSMMSLVAGDGDEEEGEGEGGDEDVLAGGMDDLLVDGFEEAHTSYFAETTHASVTLPRRSQLPPATPTSNFDDVPSPSASPATRRRTYGASQSASASSSARKQASTSRLARTPPPTANDYDHDLEAAQLGEDEEDDDRVSQAIHSSGGASRKSRKSRNEEEEEDVPDTQPVTRGKKGRRPIVQQEEEEEEEQEDEEEDDRVEMGRKSMAARLSTASRRSRVDPDADTDEEEAPSAMGGQSFGYDGGADFDNDQPMDDVDLNGDDAEDDEGVDDNIGDIQGGVGGEDEDGDEGEEDEEEEDEVEERLPAARKRTAAVKEKVVRKKAVRTGEEGQTTQQRQRKKTRLSRLPNEGEDGFTGDFKARRSGRQHFAPLAYWRGEKFEYQPGPGLAVIKEVVHVAEEYVPPLAARGKRYRAGSKTRRAGSVGLKREGGKYENADRDTSQIGTVMEWAMGREAERRVAMPYARLEPKQVVGSNFKYQKVFGEDNFVAAGVVFIPPGGEKPAKPSKDNCYVFWVNCGCVDVTVHKKSFIMATGSMFLIPRGNTYSIKNISEVEAELFFTQSRKITNSEQDETTIEQGSLAPQTIKKKKKVRRSPEEHEDKENEQGEEEDEDEDAEEQTPQARKKVKGRR